MKNKVSIAVGVVLLLVATWLAASVYVGKRFEADLEKAVKSSTLSRSYRLRNLQHEGGLFSSSGQVEWVLIDACARGDEKREWFSAQVTYRLSYLISPFSLVSAEWSVMPTGKTKSAFDALFNGQANLEGKARVRLSGALESDLNLPAINAMSEGETMIVSPSKGFITLSGDSMEFDWRTEKITHRGNGGAMEIEAFSIKSDLVSIAKGLGKISVEAGKFGNAGLSAEGLTLAIDAIERGDRLDMRIAHGAKMMNVSGKQFEALFLELAITGMHAKSVEQLIALSDKSCYFRSLTMEESRQARDSIRTLLFEGLTVGIPKLTGKVDGAALNGSFMVGLGKTNGDIFELERVLTARGELSRTGGKMKAEDAKLMVSMGIAMEIPDGVKASVDYEKGIFKVNGKVFDATLFGRMLKGTNSTINAILSNRHEQLFPAISPSIDTETEQETGFDAELPQGRNEDT